MMVFYKVLLCLLCIPEILSYRFPLRMSMSEKYLSHLQNKAKIPITNEDVSNMIKTAQPTNKTEVEIENLFLNVYKMHSLFFNRKAQNIYFKPSRELTELYYYNDKKLYKLPENTTIVSKNLRNVVVTEMNHDIDGLMF